MLSQVARWTGFIDQCGHVSSGLPPSDERAFLAALIAEATNLGLACMADVCGVASRRALLRMQTWHMREHTFRAALGCLTHAIHADRAGALEPQVAASTFVNAKRDSVEAAPAIVTPISSQSCSMISRARSRAAPCNTVSRSLGARARSKR